MKTSLLTEELGTNFKQNWINWTSTKKQEPSYSLATSKKIITYKTCLINFYTRPECFLHYTSLQKRVDITHALKLRDIDIKELNKVIQNLIDKKVEKIREEFEKKLRKLRADQKILTISEGISGFEWKLNKEIQNKFEKYKTRKKFELASQNIYKGEVIAYIETDIGEYQILDHAKTYRELTPKIAEIIKNGKIDKNQRIYYRSYFYDL